MLNKPISKVDAVLDLLYENEKRTISFTGYKRSLRAMNALGLSTEDQREILERLEYYWNGELAPLIAKRLARRVA